MENEGAMRVITSPDRDVLTRSHCYLIRAGMREGNDNDSETGEEERNGEGGGMHD